MVLGFRIKAGRPDTYYWAHGLPAYLAVNFSVKKIKSPSIMENQMDKKMENEMETAIYRVM